MGTATSEQGYHAYSIYIYIIYNHILFLIRFFNVYLRFSFYLQPTVSFALFFARCIEDFSLPQCPLFSLHPSPFNSSRLVSLLFSPFHLFHPQSNSFSHSLSTCYFLSLFTISRVFISLFLPLNFFRLNLFLTSSSIRFVFFLKKTSQELRFFFPVLVCLFLAPSVTRLKNMKLRLKFK